MNPNNRSRITADKHAWTEGDEALFSEVNPEDQKLARLWVNWNLYPMKSWSRRTSYGLKHMLQRDTHIYLTNNQFKDLMLSCGYRVKNPKDINWCFNVVVPLGVKERRTDGTYPQYLYC